MRKGAGQRITNTIWCIHNLDRDTYISNESYEAATYAAGCVINAVEIAAKGEYKFIFCPIRPPGHHLGPYGAEGIKELKTTGYCLLNNVAIGCAFAKYNFRNIFKRIAILDFDMHHGNGTEAIVRNLVPSLMTEKINWRLGKLKIEKKDYKPW